jgi:hypothetical protein
VTAPRHARSRLHPPLQIAPEHAAVLHARLAQIASAKREDIEAAPAALPPGRIMLLLTTVSVDNFFDAKIYVGYKGQTSAFEEFTVDSGNSMLVTPDYTALRALPNFATDYQVLADDPNDALREPFGCPAVIVRGPIEITTVGRAQYVIPNCVFFACKGPNSSNAVTANFGIGCVSWTASNGTVMESPLSFDPSYPFAEIDFAPPHAIVTSGPAPHIDETSTLNLYAGAPPGYEVFDVVTNVEWMALRPTLLKIAGTLTSWPGNNTAIAMIDTGGGPVYLSDPNGYVYQTQWPGQIFPLPDWTNGSVSCQAVNDDVEVAVGDLSRSYTYTITAGSLPPSQNGEQNYTIVICQTNKYMFGQYGLNIGGISALFNKILIDYAGKRVGLKSKSPGIS